MAITASATRQPERPVAIERHGMLVLSVGADVRSLMLDKTEGTSKTIAEAQAILAAKWPNYVCSSCGRRVITPLPFQSLCTCGSADAVWIRLGLKPPLWSWYSAGEQDHSVLASNSLVLRVYATAPSVLDRLVMLLNLGELALTEVTKESLNG